MNVKKIALACAAAVGFSVSAWADVNVGVTVSATGPAASLYFTTELTDAIVVDVQARMPNCQDPSLAHFTHLEDIYMTYRAIKWTHEVSGTSGSDDWRSPVSA